MKPTPKKEEGTGSGFLGKSGNVTPKDPAYGGVYGGMPWDLQRVVRLAAAVTDTLSKFNVLTTVKISNV